MKGTDDKRVWKDSVNCKVLSSAGVIPLSLLLLLTMGPPPYKQSWRRSDWSYKL